MMTTKISLPKALALGVSVLALAASTASATITFDLRASSGGTITNGGKSVAIPVGGTAITFQVWAQVSSAAATANPYGIQVIQGSIRSTTNAGTAVGSMSVSTPATPFGVSNQVGLVQENSATPDSVTDLGQTGTTSSTNYISFRKDPTSGGQQIASATFMATQNSNAGATVNQLLVNQSYEFLMGTATLTLTGFSQTGNLSMNWVIPSFTGLADKKTIATWTQGDNLILQGNSTANLAVGNAVIITAVAAPEPSAFAMVALGALGLVGFRRLGFRRNS